jgi:hypothetical protein
VRVGEVLDPAGIVPIPNAAGPQSAFFSAVHPVAKYLAQSPIRLDVGD